MTINKYKPQIIGVYILVSIIFGYKGYCQSYFVINLDKVEAKDLSAKQRKMPMPDSIPNFNEIIKIENQSKTSYDIDYIPAYQPPIISKGSVFINLNNEEKVYDLESVNEVTNPALYQYQYKVFEFEQKKQTQSLLGTSYEVVKYIASINLGTGDTLWKKQKDYVSVHSEKLVSVVGNLIIDNKTGKELYKLSSSNPLSISEIKEVNEYLYLRKSDEIIAINLLNGEVIWKVKGNFNNFFIDETRIYTSNQCAIDKNTGKIIWNNSSDVWFVGIIGNYLIGYLYGEDDPEIYLYNKNTGKLAGHLWSDNEFCTSCFGYESCFPEFIFAEQGEGNKTAALIKCTDGVYLYTLEVVQN